MALLSLEPHYELPRLTVSSLSPAFSTNYEHTGLGTQWGAVYQSLPKGPDSLRLSASCFPLPVSPQDLPAYIPTMW